MTTTTRELNSIGTVNHYGPRQINDGLPAGVATYGVVKQLVLPFDFDDLDLGSIIADDDSANLLIPKFSMIRHAFLEVNTAFLGGTSISIGFDKADGTTIDDDALFTDAALATANLTLNAWLVGSGALATNDAIGADDAAITIDAIGTFTAGSARLIVEYIEPTEQNS